MVGDETDVHLVTIWANDAPKDDDIVALVDCIATVVEKYTREKPVLR